MAIGKLASRALVKASTKSEVGETAVKRITKDMGKAERVEPARLSGPKAPDKSIPSYGDRLKKAAAVGAVAGAAGYAATRGDSKEDSKPSSAPAKKATTVAAAPAARADSAPASSSKASGGKNKLSPFGSAFAAARKAGEKEFTFNGKRYHTKTKEEMMPAAKKATGVREGKNENIDDDVRKRALDSVKNLNKGGMVKKGKC